MKPKDAGKFRFAIDTLKETIMLNHGYSSERKPTAKELTRGARKILPVSRHLVLA